MNNRHTGENYITDLQELNLQQGERFKKVPNWTNYMISNNGILLRKLSDGTMRVIQPFLGGPKGNQYYYYTLSRPARQYGGKKCKDATYTAKTMKRAKVVGITFLEDYGSETQELHHINGNRYDDRADNLIWLSHENHKNIHRIKSLAINGRTVTDYNLQYAIFKAAEYLDFDIDEFIQALFDEYSFTDDKDIYARVLENQLFEFSTTVGKEV